MSVELSKTNTLFVLKFFVFLGLLLNSPRSSLFFCLFYATVDSLPSSKAVPLEEPALSELSPQRGLFLRPLFETQSFQNKLGNSSEVFSKLKSGQTVDTFSSEPTRSRTHRAATRPPARFTPEACSPRVASETVVFRNLLKLEVSQKVF